MKRPATIGECQAVLDIFIEKILNLEPTSFQWFTRDDLPNTYLLNKWLSMKRDFTDLYLNMDHSHEELFMRYCGIQHDSDYFSIVLRRFLLFCNNYDAPEYFANPFRAEHAEYLSELATGEKKPTGVRAMQILYAWQKGHRAVRLYFTRCCFGVKTKVQDTVTNQNAA